ncbi:MAG: LuxR C-terminal-related transcriptional regulator, partial [Pseudonocardia sp.]|nr:LuxR C-terminal-related transcriptional regulator [Pseudonocardia sp.]
GAPGPPGRPRDLVARAAPRRAVVAVDDSHLLDDASAALVHHLATASTVFVLATVRDGKASPDAVRLLTKDHVAEQLALDPLSAEHIGEALRQALGGQLSGAVAHHLTTLSEGNPLLVTELVEAALDEGRLVERSGLWQLTGEWVNPTTLPELVRDRLSRLAPEVRAAAELLALGEPLGAAELEVLLAPDVIGAAEREGLFVAVVTRRRQQVRLVHPLYGEALRAAIPPMRARAAHRALADALAATGARRRGDVLRLAVWRLEGGRTGDPDLLLRAAREEGALFDGGMAERLALAAEEAGGGLAARLARVDALRWSGRAVEADRLLVDADAMCGDVAQQCQVGALRASNLYFGLNRPADAERVLDETRRRVCSPAACRCPDGEEALCAKLDALKAEFLLNAGRVGEARTHTRALLARPDLGIRTYASAASIASVAQTWSGRSGQGGAVAAQALARCGEAGGELHFASTELLHFSRCLAQLYAGQHALAGQLAAGRYQRALERHAEVLQGQWALALGELALFSGRVATARRWLREAAALIEQHSPSMGRYGVGYALTFTAEAAALAGDLPGVDAALSRAAALLPDSARLCNRERGRVWAAATRGELTTARSLALAGADALAAVGAHLHEAMACHDVARLGAPQSVTARLNALAPTFEGRLGTLYARHAEALAARDGPALEAVAADFATLGATLLAAEAAAEAADAHRRAGRKTSALAASRRSRELAGRCEGARTPALALAGDPLPLTPREQEIATLAAHGLTDRDIAQRLVVSRRTVHNHLHRTYTKLGIAGRRQLRSVLG